MTPRFFESPAAFRRWLARHHTSSTELVVGFWKKSSGHPSLTWPESVDEALCFGWIDGVRRSIDADRYCIRFTPRRRGSYWSAVNTRRAAALIRDGRMQPAGLRTFESRDAQQSARYSFERESAHLDDILLRRFQASRAGWQYFQAQPPGYRKLAIWWVVSARRDETRARRLATLIADSEAGRRLAPLRRVERDPAAERASP